MIVPNLTNSLSLSCLITVAYGNNQASIKLQTTELSDDQQYPSSVKMYWSKYKVIISYRTAAAPFIHSVRTINSSLRDENWIIGNCVTIESFVFLRFSTVSFLYLATGARRIFWKETPPKRYQELVLYVSPQVIVTPKRYQNNNDNKNNLTCS